MPGTMRLCSCGWCGAWPGTSLGTISGPLPAVVGCAKRAPAGAGVSVHPGVQSLGCRVILNPEPSSGFKARWLQRPQTGSKKAPVCEI